VTYVGLSVWSKASLHVENRDKLFHMMPQRSETHENCISRNIFWAVFSRNRECSCGKTLKWLKPKQKVWHFHLSWGYFFYFLFIFFPIPDLYFSICTDWNINTYFPLLALSSQPLFIIKVKLVFVVESKVFLRLNSQSGKAEDAAEYSRICVHIMKSYKMNPNFPLPHIQG
jgi:hypothetical protein